MVMIFNKFRLKSILYNQHIYKMIFYFYILFFVIFIILIIYSYYKWKYRLWFQSPFFFQFYLFPSYWFRRWKYFHQPIIDKQPLIKQPNTTVIPYSCLKTTTLQKQFILSFVKKNMFYDYFNELIHNEQNRITWIQTPITLIDDQQNTTVKDQQISSCLCSHSTKLQFYTTQETFQVEQIYIVTLKHLPFLLPLLLSYHHSNTSNSIFLLRFENVLSFITPLCLFGIYQFPTLKWSKPLDMHTMFTLVELNQQTSWMLQHFLDDTNLQKYFDIVMISDMNIVLSMIQKKKIHVFFILQNHHPKSCYFFRNQLTSLCCYSSFCDQSLDNSIFIQGFKINCWNLLQTYPCDHILIENIGHNNLIIANLCNKTFPSKKYVHCYYLYNFIYLPFSSNRLFCLL